MRRRFIQTNGELVEVSNNDQPELRNSSSGKATESSSAEVTESAEQPPKRTYKYVGSSYLGKVLGRRNHVTLKCGYPKNFNDPYELFLTIDFKAEPGVLAFYKDVVGELPQLPTTCFSRSPTVIPMWAHYAQDSKGFAIEFDEAALSASFPESGFGDVDYRDNTSEGLEDMLYRAYEIGKYRYLYLLNRWVFSAAYYTKASFWSYELERRMIVRPSETRSQHGVMLMDVPKECVTALICGPRASARTRRALQGKAKQLGCKYYELRIGKSSAVPYFVDSSGSHLFSGASIEPAGQYCESCDEPFDCPGEVDCSWCRIDEDHEYEAAQRNSLRGLARAGLLDEYMKDMNEVGAEKRRRK